MNFIIRLSLSPNINFIKVKKRIVKSICITEPCSKNYGGLVNGLGM